MTAADLSRLLDPLAALVLVAALFAAAARRPESRQRIYAAQSLILALWLAAESVALGTWLPLAPAALALAVKLIGLARLLPLEVSRVRVDLADGPGGSLSLVAAGALAALARLAAARLEPGLVASPESLASGLGALFAGLLVAATRRRARSKLVGLLVAENGAALAALAASPALPVVALVLALELGLAALACALACPAVAEALEEADVPARPTRGEA